MKKTKQLAAVLLSLMLVLALAVPAFAQTGTYSITITNTNANHTYTAYQIFEGDISGTDTETTDYVLSNIQWGTGVNTTGLIAALKQVNGFTDLANDATAADVAEKLTDAAAVDAFLQVINGNPGFLGAPTGNGVTPGANQTSCTINLTEAGYYLVKDTVAQGAVGQSVSDYIVQVLGLETMEPKDSEIPTVEKKVSEEDYQKNDGYGTGYNDVADWDIGDSVPFKLIGSIPDMSAYDTYEYIFNDTLSDGLTLQADTIKVYIAVDKDDEVREYTPLTPEVHYTLTLNNVENGGGSFSITFNDLKTAPYIADGDRNYVIVTYDATLNANAEIGLPGNPNEVYLQFSNDPNGDGLGRTAKDTVIVFTYELDGTKVDGANVNTKLEGAEFVLFNGGHTRVAQIDENGKLVGWVELPKGYDNYQQIPYETWETFNGTTKVIMTSAAEGAFGVSGLDDGTYYLMEIKAPNGYNLLEDEVKLDITATTYNGQEWTGVAADALNVLQVAVDDGEAENGATNTGAVNVQVENNRGATLPETGGMGTTLFYIIGGLLVAGAVVLLVVRLRMKANNE